MKHLVRTALTAGIAALALGTFASSASAAGDTEDGKKWYIGHGDSYGHLTWDDNNGSADRDRLCLFDHLSPPGTSVSAKVKFGSWSDSAHVYNGNAWCVHIPNFKNGDTAYFDACGWDNGTQLECRGKTKIVE